MNLQEEIHRIKEMMENLNKKYVSEFEKRPLKEVLTELDCN